MIHTLGRRCCSSSLARAALARPATATPATLRQLHATRTLPQASPAPAQPNAPSPNDSFLSSNNAYYIESMRRLWQEDPAKVHSSWDIYFRGLDQGLQSQDSFRLPPSLMPLPIDAPPIDASAVSSGESIDDHLKVS